MKNYITGIITGVSLTASAVMFMGSQNKNLGDITVSSIRVKKNDSYNHMVIDNESLKTFHQNGGIALTESIIVLRNKNGKVSVMMGSDDKGGGLLEVRTANEKNAVKLGVSKFDHGVITTTNSKENINVFIGSNKDDDGFIVLRDRYGDIGWGMSGKK